MGKKDGRGRPPLDISIRLVIKQMFKEGKNGCQIAEELGISKSTTYRYIGLEKAKDIL